MSKFKLSLVAAALLASTGLASATEGGGSIYPVGAENFTCCALPPPGLYGLVWGQSYSADKLNCTGGGQDVTPPTFKVNATAVVPRLIWVTPYKIGDASLALHAILPLVDLTVKTPGGTTHKTGAGDLTFGPALGWHHSENLHSLFALDVFAPTGQYNAAAPSIGRNYWAIQPVLGFSYINPTGLNADVKAMYTFNMVNKDTDYRSGQELIVDYAVGWGFGNGLTAGAGGYADQQVTDDKQNGANVANNKGKAFAIGPSFRYDSGKGWFATAKYQVDTSVRNRAEGQAFWLKAVFPF